MLNVTDIRAKQERGLVTVALSKDSDANDVYILNHARFDPATGEQVEDEVSAVPRAALVGQIAALQAELDALTAFLADVDSGVIIDASTVEDVEI